MKIKTNLVTVMLSCIIEESFCLNERLSSYSTVNEALRPHLSSSGTESRGSDLSRQSFAAIWLDFSLFLDIFHLVLRSTHSDFHVNSRLHNHCLITPPSHLYRIR